MKTFMLAAMLAVSAFAAPASAAYIGIVDTNSNVGIYAGDFEYGFYANSMDAQSGALNFAGGTTISFNGTWINNGQTPTSSAVIYVLANAGDTVAISKLSYSLFSYDNYFGSIDGTYESAGGYTFGSGATTILAGQNADFSAAYSSNTLYTTAAPVPEPAMLGLFGLGAIGLGLSRRRRA